jgi:hypothetical protein
MVAAPRTARPKLTIVKQTTNVPTVKHSTAVTPKLKTTANPSRPRTHPVFGGREPQRPNRTTS